MRICLLARLLVACLLACLLAEYLPRQVTNPNSKWHVLREKLTTLVRMQSHWGNLWDIYDTRTESVYPPRTPCTPL
eukprot:COSAG05_NODE_1663_length_4312_cov_16.465243_8_plen_76_part_00